MQDRKRCLCFQNLVSSERQNQKRMVINKKGDLIYASCATIEPYEVYTFPPSPQGLLHLTVDINSLQKYKKINSVHSFYISLETSL